MVRISSSFNDRQVRGNISTPIVSNFHLRRGERMNAGVAVMFDYGQHCWSQLPGIRRMARSKGRSATRACQVDRLAD
jgi:hypothetical protein